MASNGSELAIERRSGGWWPDDNYSSVLTVSYSDVRGGEDAVYFDRGPDPWPVPLPGTLEWGKGNMDIDPLFVDTGTGDYHLRFGSACVDVGTNSPEGGLEIVDLDGNARVIDGDSDGEAVVDMGVYESFAPDVSYMATIPNEFVYHVFESWPNPEDQILQIRNIGPDGFDWQIQEDCQWLEIWPTSGRIEMRWFCRWIKQSLKPGVTTVSCQFQVNRWPIVHKRWKLNYMFISMAQRSCLFNTKPSKRLSTELLPARPLWLLRERIMRTSISRVRT
jgi:hypothetical protein